MPKKPRTEEEIEEIKANILHHALEMISREGFEGFSMRKLSRRLGVAVVTIYSYYENKDELYLAILTRGFEKLYEECREQYITVSDPLERLKAMAESYIEFGFRDANFYNLMFTWNVPKFEDYVDTPIESTAEKELEAALQVYDLFITAVRELLSNIKGITAAEIKFYVIVFWSTFHGYISGCNNTLLTYMHDEPSRLKEQILSFSFFYIEQEFEAVRSGKKRAYEHLEPSKRS